jgi:hypothetical protein
MKLPDILVWGYHYFCSCKINYLVRVDRRNFNLSEHLMNRSFTVLFLACLTSLSGCSPAPQQPESAAVQDVAAPEVAAATPVDPFAIFNTTVSVSDLMSAVINPNARELWNGVSYVESEEGVVEKMPHTQEDWDLLKTNAIALIEGSNALMLPGRSIADSAAPGERPDFQFAPAEIEQLVRNEQDNWIAIAQAMQDSALLTLEAIERKDIIGFTEKGAEINESCESCHAQYWYRPLPMRR